MSNLKSNSKCELKNKKNNEIQLDKFYETRLCQ